MALGSLDGLGPGGWSDRSMPYEGERFLVACEGGPSQSRLVRWPFPLEIVERGGLYVLRDTGPVQDWSYLWVANVL